MQLSQIWYLVRSDLFGQGFGKMIQIMLMDKQKPNIIVTPQSAQEKKGNLGNQTLLYLTTLDPPQSLSLSLSLRYSFYDFSNQNQNRARKCWQCSIDLWLSARRLYGALTQAQYLRSKMRFSLNTWLPHTLVRSTSTSALWVSWPTPLRNRILFSQGCLLLWTTHPSRHHSRTSIEDQQCTIDSNRS